MASQLILHPFASNTLDYLATTLGRDKLYRAIQYFARFLAWYLVSRGYKDEGARWNSLKDALGAGRKLMRLGKPLEHLQSALKASQSLSHPAEQLTTIGRQLGYAGYLVYDSFVWLNAVRVLRLSPQRAASNGKLANRFWLSGILFGICNYLLKAGRLANEVKQLRRAQAWGEKNADNDNIAKIAALEKLRSATRYQFTLDIFDIWIPATNLGLVTMNDGLVGLCGFISSLLALRTQWDSVTAKTKRA